jgi:predicted dehydrogenase
MARLPVGVVGVGHLGEAHLKKYKILPDVQLVGFWDVNPLVREEMWKRHSVPAYTSLEELLDRVGAVSVVVPTSEHASVAIEAAERGVHIFVEKPIAPTIADADKIINAAEKNGVTLQVGHIERFNPAFRSLHSYQPHGLQPQFIESHRLSQFNPRGLDVSVVLDLMIHDIDLIHQLIPVTIARVEASGVCVISDSADIVNTRLVFENGAVANVTASRISQKKMRKMRLFQKEAYISMDFALGETELFKMGDLCGGFDVQDMMKMATLEYGEVSKHIGYKKVLNDGQDALELELESFICSISSRTVPVVTGSEARKALKTALDIIDKIGR